MGSMERFLDINLSTGEVKERRVGARELALYLGGRGLGARLLYDNTPPGLDPFDDRMVLIFSVGPLTGTSAPQSNRFVVTTKSPLTFGLADSHCGGDFATRLRSAGYGAVLVRGRSPKPVYVQITDDRVEILDAAHLWGLGAHETQARLPRDTGKAVIGPAGEHRVRFAAIVSGHRLAGRTGTGAVMGAKNLKAIVARGTRPVEVARPEGFKKLKKQVIDYFLAHPILGRVLPDLGTANLVMTTAGRNISPTRNFQAGRDARTPQLAGERMRDLYLKRKDGCLHCPVRCGRELAIDGVKHKGPEYETLGMLGANLDVYDLRAVIELGELCDDLGLDSISTGNVLGFATELTAKGQLASDLRWGDAATYRKAIEDIAHRRGLGDELAEGTRRLADRHGGHAFAIHAKGLELPAYDPRGCVGQGLEYATSNRGGCHVRGSTMFLEATGPFSIDPHSTRAKPELVILQQNTSAAVSSLSMCYFSAYGMLPGLLLDLDPNSLPYLALSRAALSAGPLLRLVLQLKSPVKALYFEKLLTEVFGRDVTMGEFNEIGERVFNLERMYNLREGLTGGDTLPARLLQESTFAHLARGVPLAEMLPTYYRVRGWDASGVPTDETLRRLRIEV